MADLEHDRTYDDTPHGMDETMETTDSRADEGEHHATTGGAALAGAITGGVVGLVGGPIGAVAGAVGGAIIGAAGERVMHADDDREGAEMGLDNDHDANPFVESREEEMPRGMANTGTSLDTHDGAGDATMSAATVDRPGTMDRGTDGSTVRLHEEELTPRKHLEQTGEVGLRKEVHTERQTMDVSVTREEVVVERHPVDRTPADSADFRPEGQEIRVPVHEEQVTVEKRPVVTEEVTVGKRAVQDTQTVSGDVRREEAHLEREGDVEVSGWDETRSRYQQRWQNRYGMTGGRWEDAEPAYSYGWQYRNDPRFRGRSWTDVEPDLRRDWETQYRDRPWDRSRDFVRDAWDDTTS